MRSENESPYDVTGNAGVPVKLARRSGNVYVLEPRPRSEDPVKSEPTPVEAPLPEKNRGGSRTRRVVSVGVGSLVMLALVILSSIFSGIQDPSLETLNVSSVGMIDRLEDRQPRASKVLGPFSSFPDKTPQRSLEQGAAAFEIVRVMPAARPVVAVYRPERIPQRRPKLVVSKFVPTTLIIYPENGVIKTRIEPQLTAAYKRSSTLRN
jgi:hypothetical protein